MKNLHPFHFFRSIPAFSATFIVAGFLLLFLLPKNALASDLTFTSEVNSGYNTIKMNDSASSGTISVCVYVGGVLKSSATSSATLYITNAGPTLGSLGTPTADIPSGSYWVRKGLSGGSCASPAGITEQHFFTVSGGVIVPPDGFVSQDTPVDGQNNYTTITFTGTYSDSTAHFERILVTYNDVYPVASATSFTKLYTISPQSGGAIAYSFTETFLPGHTYEYQMLLAEADGSNQTSLTTAQSFGTSSATQIDGITIAGFGTLTNSAGSGSVTGTGTSFLSTLAIGDVIVVGGESCTVLSLISDTALECTPLASAHTTTAFTFSTPIVVSATYASCSTFDVFCYGKNLFLWFFSVSPNTLSNFSSLTLANSLPFSYVYDVGNLYDELFANGGSMAYTVTVPFLGSNLDLISPILISGVPYASTIKTLLGYLLYFMTAMTLYHLILRVHSQNH